MQFTRIYESQVFEALGRVIQSDGHALEMSLSTMFRAYETFKIPKGNGKMRLIEAPVEALKEVQRKILENILYRVPISPDCHGFVPGRSIVSHARLHAHQNELINYDIEDAFPSVSRSRARDALERHLGPYIKHHIPRLDRRRREGLTDLIADLVTHEDRLPQGAPTSGAMLNLALAPMDREFRKALRDWSKKGVEGLVYSRYADDLNLSAKKDLPSDSDELIRRLIHRAGFRFNNKKTRRADRALGQTLVVCGVQVDGETLRLPRKSLKKYRAIFHQAFYDETLSSQRRGQIQGILGLLHMVYGQIPKSLERPWRLLAARHQLKGPGFTRNERISGYSK